VIALPVRIRGIPVSNLDPEIGYPDRSFSTFVIRQCTGCVVDETSLNKIKKRRICPVRYPYTDTDIGPKHAYIIIHYEYLKNSYKITRIVTQSSNFWQSERFVFSKFSKHDMFLSRQCKY
jgi:hypothetical protein